MEIEKKYTFGLKKTNYMVIDEPESNQPIIVREKLEKGTVTKVDNYKYSGLYINMKGNLDLHIQKLKNRSIAITKEIMAMGSQREVGEEYLRMRMHLFEKCYMHATSWPACMAHYRRRSTSSRKSTKQLNLKVILELPTSTPSAALFMETGICLSGVPCCNSPAHCHLNLIYIWLG